SIAERMRSLAASDEDLSAIRDVFVPPPRWFSGLQPAVAARPDNVGAEFTKCHQLVAVILSRNGAQAVIGQKLVRVGQTIDGFTLVSVAPQSARFRSATSEVQLTIRGAGDVTGIGE